VGQGEIEPLRFLRLAFPSTLMPESTIPIQRAENIYRRLMQNHIDNGWKTYATAAYYCALLGEIAKHEGRLVDFRR
jgi:hypothetical protein